MALEDLPLLRLRWLCKLGLALERDRLLHAVARYQYFLIGRQFLLSVFSSLWNWKLSLATQRAILSVSGRVLLHRKNLRHSWVNLRLYEVLLLRVRWTIEEGLTIDSPSLFELLFHLIRQHLLTKSDFAHLWTLVIVNSTYFSSHHDVFSVFLINFLYKTLLVLTLQGSPYVLLCLPRIVLGARLTQILRLFFNPDLILRLLSLSVFTALSWSIEEVLVKAVTWGSSFFHQRSLGGVETLVTASLSMLHTVLGALIHLPRLIIAPILAASLHLNRVGKTACVVFYYPIARPTWSPKIRSIFSGVELWLLL